MQEKNASYAGYEGKTRSEKRQKDDDGKETKMVPNTESIPAKRKTYNTDPIPGEVVAKMADAEVVRIFTELRLAQ